MKVAFLTADLREHYRSYEKPDPWFIQGSESLLQGFAGRTDIEVHVLSCTQRPVAAPEKIAPNVWFHSLLVPKIGWLRTGYQGCIRAVRRKVRELKPDIVHGLGAERECAICAALSGFPNIVTIHGNMDEIARLFKARMGSFYWLAARLENFTLRRTSGVLCNSIYTEGLVRPRTSKTWLMPHALRAKFFEPPPDSGPRPCVLLNAGVVSPRKQQLELLDVAAALHRQGLKFEFHFIGIIPPSEPYAEVFMERIKSAEAKGYARYLGTLPEAELVAFFDSGAGLIHFPTEEAFGNVVGETLARNLKFFGTRTGGILDITEGVPEAELFATDDWAGLTESLARWIGQGHPRPKDAAAVMRRRYHPEVVAQRHLEIYHEVIEGVPKKGA